MHRSAPTKKIAAKPAKKAIKAKTQRKVTLKTQRRKFTIKPTAPQQILVVDEADFISPGPLKSTLAHFVAKNAFFKLNYSPHNEIDIIANSRNVRKRLLASGKQFATFELDLASDPYGINARAIITGDDETVAKRGAKYRISDTVDAVVSGAALSFAAAYAHDLIFSTPLSASCMIDALTFASHDWNMALHNLAPTGESTFVSRALWAIPGAIIAIPASIASSSTGQEFHLENIQNFTAPQKHALHYLKHLDTLLEEGVYNKSVVTAMTTNKVTLSQLFYQPLPKQYPQNYDQESLTNFFTQDPKHAHNSH